MKLTSSKWFNVAVQYPMLQTAQSYLHSSGQNTETDRQPMAITAVCIASNTNTL